MNCQESHRTKKAFYRDVPPIGCTSPTFRKFSVFPSKNHIFHLKKRHKIQKVTIAPPLFKKILYGPSENSKISFAPPYFFLCGTSLAFKYLH